MELRSTRSRSKTPGLFSTGSEKEVLEIGNHVEVVTRTTRSSARVIETISEGKTLKTSARRRASTRGKNVTSDYSSDDEVTSTKHITQNTQNQFIEEYQNNKSNGSQEFSALKIYKEAGEYWNKFPKTDYTYSEHSKDRIEIAPGVIAMPNMSRRSLHHIYPSSEHQSANKETNTERFLSEEVNEVINYSNLGGIKPRNLFLNNNYGDKSEVRTTTRTTSYFFMMIVTTVLSWMYSIYDKQYSSILWLGQKIYKFVSRVMLLDTWTLQGRNNKTSALMKLCILSLLFFAGWGAVSWLGGTLFGASGNSTSIEIPPVLPIISTEELIDVKKEDDFKPPVISVQADLQNEKNIEKSNFKPSIIPNPEPIIQEKIIKITEKVTLEPPTAEEIVSLLKKSQLQAIGESVKVDENIIINKIMESPVIKNIVNQYNTILLHSKESADDKVSINIVKHQEDMINSLKLEIEKIHLMLNDLQKSDNNNKNHFEEELIKLKSEFDKTLENNGKLLIDTITTMLRKEFNSQLLILKTEKESQRQIVTLDETSISEDRIKAVVNEALLKYDADKTGLVDFALEPSGGQILSTRCTENYIGGSAVVSVFGIPLWSTYLNTPRAVITPGIVPGECWAFQNFPGFLVIKLSAPVKLEAFSYEHVSHSLVPNGKIDSAPKEFQVFGLLGENDKNPVLIGTYTYDFYGKPLQFFPAQNTGHVFDIVELRVISNHGNPNYTCLYRFRVHGSLSTKSRDAVYIFKSKKGT